MKEKQWIAMIVDILKKANLRELRIIYQFALNLVK